MAAADDALRATMKAIDEAIGHGSYEILHERSDTPERYSYTVGLWPILGFEMLVSGVPAEQAGVGIASIVPLVGARRFHSRPVWPGEPTDGLLPDGVQVMFLPIYPDSDGLEMSFASAWWGGYEHFEAWQLVWPMHGCWPWEAGFPAELRQPIGLET